tara:strand:+ start:25 stop:345 length:321 start_codon:yes stop_codon:yes gene_type:complete
VLKFYILGLLILNVLKKIIIVNIAVFLFGNELFEAIHYFESHSNSISTDIHDCQECLVFENNSNYHLDSYNVYFFKNKFIFITPESFRFVISNLKFKNCSRAPPFS